MNFVEEEKSGNGCYAFLKWLPVAKQIYGGGKMGFRKTRSFLYKIDRLSGDFKAVKNGTIGNRIGKRILRKTINRLLWKFFKI
ncbi:hypothetical protein QWY22_04615 [Planococcus liqunii]|uniref:hypothetical protein n=1 Tax=Planococcus liqunii TaxID=3058394 RepID=UPI002625255F|nr:hypothetical protein [Planococcus sp. N056]WKA51894.1 hypothetical protein QWY22_04615 [Planococcus sp. N056]